MNHVTIQCRDQGRLLDEANRDLEVFKKAYYKAERDMHDHQARFEQEKQALYEEIHQLKVRLFPNDRLVLIVSRPQFRQQRLVKSELWY